MCGDEDCSFGMHRMVAAEQREKMWLGFVTILLNSSSSAEEQR